MKQLDPSKKEEEKKEEEEDLKALKINLNLIWKCNFNPNRGIYSFIL